MPNFKDHFNEPIPEFITQEYPQFEDCSWKNDATARMEWPIADLTLWIAPEDPNVRDLPVARYMLAAGIGLDQSDAVLIETESEDDLKYAIWLHLWGKRLIGGDEEEQ
jgi:hypothetical protein